MSPQIAAAEARHQIANLLYTYTEIADRKDVPAALEMLGDTVVTFPTDGYRTRSEAAAFFGRLWGGDVPHRHDVTNLVVEHTDDRGWSARAHYTRYVLDPAPTLTTLGEYALTVSQTKGHWSIRELTVTRTWSR